MLRFCMALATGLLVSASASAHNGGLDKYGCHNDRKSGNYHCHRGPHTAPSATKKSAPVVTGVASVIDGDTLEIHGQRIRLHGIDAPESKQLCKLDGRDYRCGQQAALALSDKIGRQTVSCEQKDVDRYKRIVAVCRLGDEDLNGWLVSNGHALAYRQYSKDYIATEDMAKAAKIGVWRGEFEAPWEWRKR